VLAVAVALAALMASCGGSSTTGDRAEAAEGAVAEQVTIPTPFPSGVTLRVGDQLDYFKNILALSGQDQGLPYTIEYANFLGGPAMLQAFQAGEIDLGFVANTPLIFAQAANQDIVAIAGWVNGRSPLSLVTAPGVDDIHGWADLEGRSVAMQHGTVLQAAVLSGLDGVGLAYDAVDAVDLPTTQVSQALEGRSADAGILPEPLSTAYLQKNPTARKVADAAELTDRTQFVIATEDVFANAGRTAAAADFVARLVKAFQWINANPEAWAQELYVDQYGISLEKGVELLTDGGGSRFVELPGELVEPTQRLADLYVDAGEIPKPLDVTAQFDPRFNTIVKEASSR